MQRDLWNLCSSICMSSVFNVADLNFNFVSFVLFSSFPQATEILIFILEKKTDETKEWFESNGSMVWL